MINLGERLKALRLHKGRRQIDIARVMKVNQSVVSMWENNIKEPNDEHKKHLAKYYRVSYKKLYYDE